MQVAAVICEYNPFHRGHAAQFSAIRETLGAETAIVCLMSGNYVQRGAPAIFDKSLRAKAALLCGADLVLELPVGAALSSAEGFARGGVEILAPFSDYLCFGSESGDGTILMETARVLLDPAFPPLLRQELERGLSFPAARQAALENIGAPGAVLERPNDILGVEYCKAILSGGYSMKPLVIRRPGSYHDPVPDPEHPSATALRMLAQAGMSISDYLPPRAAEVLENAPVHSLSFGERALLYRLRTMEERDFEALPFGSEGLWRKLMHEARRQESTSAIAEAVKSKRYTRSRIDRMMLCAGLGLTRADLETPAPYVRVLGFTDRGRAVLKRARQSGTFLNAGEPVDHPYWALENRLGVLYGLFARAIEPPGAEKRRRVVCISENPRENSGD